MNDNCEVRVRFWHLIDTRISEVIGGPAKYYGVEERRNMSIPRQITR